MEESRRLDKWLWYARFFKTRSIATRFCQQGKLRINGNLVRKAHAGVRSGDVLTFPKGPHIRVVRVVELGERRGPAKEAQTLYEDLAPPVPPSVRDKTAARESASSGRRDPGSGRPTKADRRALDRLRPRG